MEIGRSLYLCGSAERDLEHDLGGPASRSDSVEAELSLPTEPKRIHCGLRQSLAAE